MHMVMVSRKMRSCKSARFPYRGGWQENFSELLAIEAFKSKVAELQDKTTNVFSILLSCFRRYEISPSPSAYSFVIKYVARRRLFSQIPAILHHLEHEEQLEVPEKVFLGLIQHYGKANMLKDAMNIFFRIPKFRCTPSVLSLNSLLSILCKKKEGLVLIQDVLMKTPEMNIHLEATTFHILIRALCKIGKVGSALELLKAMHLDESYPEGKLYSVVLSSLCEHAGAKDILTFLEDMRNAGHLPTALEYNSVIDVLVKEGKVNHAYSLLEHLKSGKEGRCFEL
ncbi:pentatricopeptide repeat-containing protein At2g38420, mitochondrial-like isoform X1 [Phalaenopsis equestris]|uniref:pentatricopeptide repeat-containing protein At2g38420, mitochondrial-like isoform X1 n=1 Tax=Phalaenopsis equestris TaxID=78828 RepID=UPI0009E47418|nr:pentatricopeptide repeat-containing protein At2g38420, mitochondrial-like isoform X1 [Phalaenopsis equestris]